ncbi:MAG: MFS transporter [Prevotella sp.]|jgi:PAT family beta-lactamase induction signal transducer AmpG|nr:MFS transporter [Prevotella sp.]MCH4212003.1 MFS transporter [Prevotella sp.]MCH4241292.1 MFS transporter [Prevotella sp.]MCI1741701.1 MFS transporter [Prevotella sp.]
MNNHLQDFPVKDSTARPWAWVPSLYFAEGLPYVAVMTITIILYKQLGLSNARITFYTSWLYLPWVIKPLWGSFIDLVKTKRWWVAAMELLIGAAFGGIAFTIPTGFWLQGSLFFFWVMAFASATHNIAADSFYLLGLEDQDQVRFSGIRSTFYRLATIFGQGILVMIAGNLQLIFRNNIQYSWSLLFYGVMGLFLVLWLWHSYVLPHPKEDQKSYGGVSEMWKGFKDKCITFSTKFPVKNVIVSLFFMLLFCVPAGLLIKVSSLFLIDAPHNGGLGLSPQEYGLVQGTIGVIGLTLGGVLGGFCTGRDGLKKWLWPMVCAFTLPNLLYVYLSYALPSNLMIVNVCVFLEQFGYGFGFTAYMLYLIYYSQGKFKTSHYTLCTALMALSMMISGLFAGALQELVGYRHFFIIVMCSCLLTFIVSFFLKIDPEFGKKRKNEVAGQEDGEQTDD